LVYSLQLSLSGLGGPEEKFSTNKTPLWPKIELGSSSMAATPPAFYDIAENVKLQVKAKKVKCNKVSVKKQLHKKCHKALKLGKTGKISVFCQFFWTDVSCGRLSVAYMRRRNAN